MTVVAERTNARLEAECFEARDLGASTDVTERGNAVSASLAVALRRGLRLGAVVVHTMHEVVAAAFEQTLVARAARLAVRAATLRRGLRLLASCFSENLIDARKVAAAHVEI
jgi:hypothetical protein